MGFTIAGIGNAAPGRENFLGKRVLGKSIGPEEFVDLQIEKQRFWKRLFISGKRVEQLKSMSKAFARKTGVQSRDILYDEDKQLNLPGIYLCIKSMEDCLKRSGIEREDVDGIIYASGTPDYIYPNDAEIAVDFLGLKNAKPINEFNMACSSFVKALQDAATSIEDGMCENVLLVLGDINSRLELPDNETEKYIFGDGITTVLVKKSDKGGIVHTGIQLEPAMLNLFAHRSSFSNSQPYPNHQYYGRYNDSGLNILGTCEALLWPWLLDTFAKKEGISIDADTRIIGPQATNSVQRAGIALYKEKTEQDISQNFVPPSTYLHGNTGAGSTPLAIFDAVQSGKVKLDTNRMIFCLVGVGGKYAVLMIDPKADKAKRYVDLKKDEKYPDLKKVVEERLKALEESDKYEPGYLESIFAPMNRPTLLKPRQGNFHKQLDRVASLL